MLIFPKINVTMVNSNKIKQGSDYFTIFKPNLTGVARRAFAVGAVAGFNF